MIEIAVGPKPEPQAVTYFENMLDAWELRAHHTVPLDKVYRPTPENQGLVDVLAEIGVTTYSIHLPYMAWDDKWKYLCWYRDKLGERDIHFAVETMYYPLRSDQRLGRRYDVWGRNDITTFLEEADKLGWKRPLVIDLAHLNITAHKMTKDGSGSWVAFVRDLISEKVACEYHFSGNDGTRDNHEELRVNHRPHNLISHWLKLAVDRDEDAVIIDEGRRR